MPRQRRKHRRLPCGSSPTCRCGNPACPLGPRKRRPVPSAPPVLTLGRALPPAPQLSPPAEACSLGDLASGAVRGDVLVNTTSVGMHPQASPGAPCCRHLTRPPGRQSAMHRSLACRAGAAAVDTSWEAALALVGCVGPPWRCCALLLWNEPARPCMRAVAPCSCRRMRARCPPRHWAATSWCLTPSTRRCTPACSGKAPRPPARPPLPPRPPTPPPPTPAAPSFPEGETGHALVSSI